MARQGRELEELVARIEGQLCPKGAVVKSPDFILDKITGELREVDVSIRCTVGSASILVTVECRDRVAVQDVTWIEQLATKRSNIGADKTIAVSSSSFSEPALTSASHHGIDTRLISEITDEDIAGWTKKVIITVCYVEYGKLTAVFHWDDPSVTGLDSEMNAAFQSDPYGTPIVCHKASEKWFTARYFIADYAKQKGPLDRGLNTGDNATRTIACDFPNGACSSKAAEGEKDLTRLELHVELKVKEERLPWNKVYRYSDRDRCISDVAQTEFPLGNDKSLILIVDRKPDEPSAPA